jgi:hypothetical protein
MAWKRKVSGGMVALIGYVLSPLSWWNDAFVNIPLALAFAWLISMVYRPAFEVSWIIGYWLTNVAGFVLMHKGAQTALSDKPKPYSRRDLVKDVLISLIYTGVIVLLLKLGVIKPITSYFKSK